MDNTSKSVATNRISKDRAALDWGGKRDLKGCVLKDGCVLSMLRYWFKKKEKEEMVANTGERRDNQWTKIPEKVGYSWIWNSMEGLPPNRRSSIFSTGKKEEKKVVEVDIQP